MNEIKVNQWYSFKSRDDKKLWLTTLRENLREALISFDMSFLIVRELLYLERINNESSYRIRYRTCNHDYYELNVETWIPDKVANDTVQNNEAVYSKGVNKMNINELVAAKEKEVFFKLEEDSKKLEYEELKKTEAGKAVMELITRLNKQEKVKVEFGQVMNPFMLSEEDAEKINKVREKSRESFKKMNVKFAELRTLLSIAESFEQKVSLLKHFNILEFVGDSK